MVPRDWELRWMQEWPESEIVAQWKPFLGIGPDDMRMAAGNTMPWPYNANGTINQAYFKKVEYYENLPPAGIAIQDDESISVLQCVPVLVDRLESMRGATMCFESLGRWFRDMSDRQIKAFIQKNKS